MTAQRRYVVWGAARSGTSWAADLVAQHPEVKGLHEILHDPSRPEPDSYEVLGRTVVPRWLRVLAPDRARVRFLDELLRPSDEHPIVGGKILFPDVVWPARLSRSLSARRIVRAVPQLHRHLTMRSIGEWIRDNDVLVIIVIRENLLKLRVSALLAKQTGKYWSTQGERELTSVEVEVSGRTGIVNELLRLERQNAAVLAYGSQFDHVVCTYESGREVIRATIDAALGLEGAEDRESTYAKQSPDDLRRSITNYDEVAAALSGTRFAHFLSS